jgi:ATP-dependent Lon protease
MAEAKSVPVLFVKDPIVLPGMVVPVALEDAARAAVDAARATRIGQAAAPRCASGEEVWLLRRGRLPL